MIVDHRQLGVDMMIGEEGGREGGKETADVTIGRGGGAGVQIVGIGEEVDIRALYHKGTRDPLGTR